MLLCAWIMYTFISCGSRRAGPPYRSYMYEGAKGAYYLMDVYMSLRGEGGGTEHTRKGVSMHARESRR